MNKRLRTLALMLLLSALLVTSIHIQAQGKDVTFASTQFNVVEETAKIKTILGNFKDGNVKFAPSDEGPLLDTLKAESQAGKGANDVIGALHGTFPNLVEGDLLLNQADLLAEISKGAEISPTLVELGKLGTKDFQYYIPWMQATYVMAASKDALQYLPQGADLNSLTWAQIAAWAKTMQEK